MKRSNFHMEDEFVTSKPTWQENWRKFFGIKGVDNQWKLRPSDMKEAVHGGLYLLSQHWRAEVVELLQIQSQPELQCETPSQYPPNLCLGKTQSWQHTLVSQPLGGGGSRIRSLVIYCNGLNENGPQRLIYLNEFHPSWWKYSGKDWDVWSCWKKWVAGSYL